MNKIVPSNFFLTCGIGVDKDPVISFGLALKSAGIAQYNLVPVSSIIPRGCKLINKEEGIKLLSPGQIINCVLAKKCTTKADLITAAIGVAIPSNPTEVGCIYELTNVGKPKLVVGKEAEELAVELLAKSVGVIACHSLNIVSEAMGKEDVTTTVVAVAVFI